jgi:hypothetical protein
MASLYTVVTEPVRSRRSWGPQPVTTSLAQLLHVQGQRLFAANGVLLADVAHQPEHQPPVSGTPSVKAPSAFVEAPFVVPFTSTVTPGRLLLVFWPLPVPKWCALAPTPLAEQ